MFEVFNTATQYLPFAFYLFLTVLVAPALAFFPRMLCSPIATSAIPVISIGIVSMCAAILIHYGWYTHQWVIFIAMFQSTVALIRVGLLIHHHRTIGPIFNWDKTDLYYLLFNSSLLLPLFVFSALSGFISNDALASWNYWALYYYFSKSPDTIGYPPFFPLFISYCYHLVGNIDYQGPIKAILCVLPFTVLNVLIFINKSMQRHFILFGLLLAIVVFPAFFSLKIYNFYAIGYADPLLTAALAIALAHGLLYLEAPTKNKSSLWYAGIASMVVSLSKQPGLLWIFLVFPLLFLAKTIRI